MKNFINVAFITCLVIGIILALGMCRAEAAPVEAYKSGEMKGVFLGESAGYDSLMSVIINGVQESPYQAVHNHGTAIGDSRIFGNLAMGDTIIFKLEVLTTGNTWYSDPSMNIDGKDHFKIVNISGGVFVGAEDLYNLGDADFNDHMMAFSRVAEVPEPSQYLLFLLGLTFFGYLTHARKNL